MTDRPIIFSAPMVRALLEGRKTQTRRILNPQPVPFKHDDGRECDVGLLHIEGARCPRITLGRVVIEQEVRYAVGDRLYVRENIWQASPYPGTLPCGDADESQRWSSRLVFYAADGNPPNTPNRHHPSAFREGSGCFSAPDPYASWLRRPSIHMPRWASRLTLIVTGVKVERLQDISTEDALAEGVIAWRGGWSEKQALEMFLRGTQAAVETGRGSVARRLFYLLWTTINGEQAWTANPFVVAITFRVIKANIDAPEARAA